MKLIYTVGRTKKIIIAYQETEEKQAILFLNSVEIFLLIFLLFFFFSSDHN